MRHPSFVFTGINVTDQDNPLLQAFDLPTYSAIRPEHIEPAIDKVLAESRAAIAQLLVISSNRPGTTSVADGRTWRTLGRSLESSQPL